MILRSEVLWLFAIGLSFFKELGYSLTGLNPDFSLSKDRDQVTQKVFLTLFDEGLSF